MNSEGVSNGSAATDKMDFSRTPCLYLGKFLYTYEERVTGFQSAPGGQFKNCPDIPHHSGGRILQSEMDK